MAPFGISCKDKLERQHARHRIGCIESCDLSAQSGGLDLLAGENDAAIEWALAAFGCIVRGCEQFQLSAKLMGEWIAAGLAEDEAGIAPRCKMIGTAIEIARNAHVPREAAPPRIGCAAQFREVVHRKRGDHLTSAARRRRWSAISLGWTRAARIRFSK